MLTCEITCDDTRLKRNYLKLLRTTIRMTRQLGGDATKSICMYCTMVDGFPQAKGAKDGQENHHENHNENPAQETGSQAPDRQA